MSVTIEDVAARAGVSKTTVSRILNGNYGHTSKETRDRVLNVIRELDYRPNTLAKGLKQMKTNAIGIVLSNLKNPFWIEVLEGTEDACRQAGYQLMICNSNEEIGLEENSIKGLQSRRADGIIVNPTGKNPLLFQELIARSYPLVFINRKMPALKVDSVAIDNVKGAALATQHLLALGKRRIAVCVYHAPHINTWQERLEGYRRTMLASGVPERELLVYEVPQTRGKAREAVEASLRSGPVPDAILSTNNMMTLEILDAIRGVGLTVPDDIALIGYDEMVWAKHLNPPLTTVKQPGYEMGQLAAQRLIRLLQAGERGEPATVVLEPTLIVRSSCGAGG